MSGKGDMAARVGLCATCAYARSIPHPRGGEPYWRCGKHDEDKTYPKYPRLPMVACGGYRQTIEKPSDAEGHSEAVD